METIVARNSEGMQRQSASEWREELQAFERDLSRALTLEEFDRLCDKKLKDMYGV